MNRLRQSDQGPLHGVRVLDLSRYVPGPFCSLLLAELGAEVCKVEEPQEGDPLRELDPEAFRRLNRGKKSLTLNLKSQEGRSIFLALVERGDVLIEGFRPGVMRKLALEPERLRGMFPDLVYISITGYGQDGPYRERAGHDLNYMAAAGALGDEVPRIQVADFAGGGLYAALAVVSALYHRRSSGKGACLDLAMLDGVVSFLGLAVTSAGERLSGLYPNYSLYRTRDRHLLSVGALEPKFWEAFCQAIHRPDLRSRAGDPGARSEVASVLASQDLSDWERRFSGIDACVEPLLSPAAALQHPQVVHRRVNRAGRGLPPCFHGELAPSAREAPVLGEHTGEILREAGLAPDEIDDLRARGLC